MLNYLIKVWVIFIERHVYFWNKNPAALFFLPLRALEQKLTSRRNKILEQTSPCVIYIRKKKASHSLVYMLLFSQIYVQKNQYSLFECALVHLLVELTL